LKSVLVVVAYSSFPRPMSKEAFERLTSDSPEDDDNSEDDLSIEEAKQKIKSPGISISSLFKQHLPSRSAHSDTKEHNSTEPLAASFVSDNESSNYSSLPSESESNDSKSNRSNRNIRDNENDRPPVALLSHMQRSKLERICPDKPLGEPVVIIHHLFKDYQLAGRKEVVNALKSINLNDESEIYPILRGEFVMIRGPSGGGNSIEQAMTNLA
jgi:ABC-type glutathione transport system ATPase component